MRNKLLTGLIKPVERHDLKRERIHLDEDKILDVMRSLNSPKHYVIALIQHFTGVRAGDIMKLKKGGIMYETYKDEPVIRLNLIGKGGKRNVVFIHNPLGQDIIMKYILNNSGCEDYYFLNLGTMKRRRGNIKNEDMLMKMNYLWYWSDLKQALETNGVNREDFATHDIRRCYARRAWTRWPDIHVLQGLLNHSDPKVTLKYLDQSGLKNIDYHHDMQT